MLLSPSPSNSSRHKFLLKKASLRPGGPPSRMNSILKDIKSKVAEHIQMDDLNV